MEEILLKGDTGPAVSGLQTLLRESGFAVSEDGVYGEETAAQVCAFQQERGLPVTGEADIRTRALLTLLSRNDTDEPVFFGDADRDGMLTAKDALLIVRSLLSPARNNDLTLLDANGDGRIDGKDALFLVKCLFGKARVRSVREKAAGLCDEPAVSVKSLLAGLDRETPLRRALVTEALQFAYDPLTEPLRPFPRSLYLWGADLYTEKKELFCPAPADIEWAAVKRPAFFNGGRRELMLRALTGGEKLSAADCSGAIVGLWRRFSLCEPSFDAPAAVLMTMGKKIPVEALRPGDLVGFPGHIGLYAGSGAVVEWVGGAFGCQLTRLFDRRCWSFTDKKLVSMKAQFDSFLRPDCLPE